MLAKSNRPVSQISASHLCRTSTLIAVFFFVFVQLPAQTQELVDSLEQQLSQAENDIDRIYWLNRLTWVNLLNNPDQSEIYNSKARELAESMGDSLAMARSHHYDGIRFRLAGSYELAIEHLNSALEIFEKTQNQVGISGALFNLGVVYSNLGYYGLSLEYYQRHFHMSEEQQDTTQMADGLNSMASVHRKMQNYDKAIERYHEALELLEVRDQLWNLTNVKSNLGNLYLELNRPDDAEPYIRAALKNNHTLDDKWGLGYSYIALGHLYQMKGMADSAEVAFIESLSLRRSLNLQLETAESLIALSELYSEMNQPETAIPFAEEGLSISTAIGALEAMTNAHRVFAEIASQLGQFETSIIHLKHHSALRDSASTLEKSRIAGELEAKFETARKDRLLALNALEIAESKATTRRQNTLIQWGLGSAIAITFLLGLFIINLRTRRKLTLAELNNLKREKEVATLKSLMAGVEQERARIARDLHDGLGAHLAAVQLQFDHLKPEADEEEKRVQFQHAIKQLNDASKEVRRIAHHMSPEILSRFGLKTALESFIDEINATKSLQVNWINLGLNDRLADDLELTVYRVIQELLSNIMKHSNATEALVQVQLTEDQLSITVEDNGKGYDSSESANGEGVGLSNLRSRIALFNGRIDIDSSPLSGTSVFIEFNLKPQTSVE